MLELKDNIRPIFKAKTNVPFSALDLVNQELERFEKMDVIFKDNYLEKEQKDPRMCRSFNRIK